MMHSQTQSSGSKQNKFHIVNLDVDVVILNKKVKQVQLAVVPDIWVSDGICYYPNSKNSLPYVMRRSPVGKNWKTYPSTIKSTFDTYTEARIKLAGINSDIETTDSQHDACAAVNEEGRPNRKKRKPTRQLSADESAEDSDSSDSDLEECADDEDVQPAVPAGLCAEKNKSATCYYVPPQSSTAPDRQVFTVPLTVNDVRSSQQPTAGLINQLDQPAIMPPPFQQSFIPEHVSNGEPSSSYHRESYHAPPRYQQQFYPTSDSWAHNSAMQQQTHTAASNETVQNEQYSTRAPSDYWNSAQPRTSGVNYHINGYQQQSRISENRYLTEIGRVVNTVPETPLLTQNLPNNTPDTVSVLPRRDLPSLDSTQQTKKRHRHPEQESFELSVFKSFAQISQGNEKLSKALQVISIAIEKGQSSIALPTMEFDGLPVKDIESLRLLEIKLLDPATFKEFVLMVSRIGGNGAANFVDRAWEEILSVNAKVSCNWKGAKRKRTDQKYGLENSTVTAAVFKAVLDKFSGSDKNELTNFTKLAVKHAPGKQRKQNAAAAVAEEDEPLG